MKRPTTNILIVGHPVISVPVTLAGGALLIAGFWHGALFPIFGALGILSGVQGAARQASAYRSWKADWDAMSGEPGRSKVRVDRIMAAAAVLGIALFAYANPLFVTYWAAYALGWVASQHWLLATLGLIVAIILYQFVRHWPRRAKLARPVTVVAKCALPVPQLADAYRALPDYCQALLRGDI